MLDHGGARAGYGSYIRIFPSQQVAIAVLTNVQGGELPKTVERASELLVPLTAPEKVSPPEPKEMTLAEMSEYTGVYNNGGKSGIEIFIREGKLFVKYGNQELQLQKIGDRRLMAKEPGAAEPDEWVMLPNKTGKITYIQVGSGALMRQR